MSPTLDNDDPFEPVENNSFDEDLDFDDGDDDDVFCEGCGLPFDESELDEDGLCHTCREVE